jgi:hypothetical protein
MSFAARMQRKHIDPDSFREYLVNALLIAGTLGIVTFMCAAFTIVWEVNAIRVAQDRAINDTQRGLFSRMDSALWKIDTFLVSFGATNQALAKELLQVRVQVKQSQDAQAKQTQAISQVATSVARESLKATENAVQAVVDKAPPVVEVKTPSATVQVSPAPAPAVLPFKENPPPEPSPAETPRKRRWLRRLWPF